MSAAALRKAPAGIPGDDPLWRKFTNAPLDPEPPPEHEPLALEQARVGGFVKGSHVSAEIARRATVEMSKASAPRRRQ